ncbi:MAG TPA: hypothetical protein VGP70_27935 [Actinomadura sp.]|nr:hypothetical protein [Actinomadura sp.]
MAHTMRPGHVLGIGIALTAFFAWQVGSFAWSFTSGHPTTARVEKCVHAGRSTTCKGSWPLAGDGVGRGTIKGISDDDAGHDVPVRARQDIAIATRASSFFLPGVFLVGLLWGVPTTVLIRRKMSPRPRP